MKQITLIFVAVVAICLLAPSEAAFNNYLRPNPCPQGTKWFNGCNECFCGSDVNDEICTNVVCKRDTDRPDLCPPGSAYFNGQRWCFCHPNPKQDVCLTIAV